LFRSSYWRSEDIEKEQFNRAKTYAEKQHGLGHRVLAFWDDSVVEKHESWKAEGLCAVRSSRANRLTRIKPGYYEKPKSPICVPGYEWSAVLLGGLNLVPMVAKMQWWTTKGLHKECRSNIFYRMLKSFSNEFGQLLTHVLDRGYASEDTLEKMFRFKQKFIVRWKGLHKLMDGEGAIKNTWRIVKGKKGLDKREVWDKERKQKVKIEIYYEQVKHPELVEEYPDNQLFVVVIRNKTIRHQEPMYLLTNENIDTIGMAWEMFFSYIRRWDVEQAFRFNKSELGIQSIRLWKWENRQKMMAIVVLVYDFLLQLLRNWRTIADAIIKKYCKRTGKRLSKARQPLYRFRIACHSILFLIWCKNSG
jgi:transposase